MTKTKLKDVCDRITVGFVGPMADKYVADGVPFLRSQNITPFRLHMDDIKFVPRDFHERLHKSALRPGDVTVVRTGYPGTACVVPKSLAESNCADLVVITPSKALNPYYLAAIFNSAWGRASVAGNLVGVAQQHFNVGSAKEMQVMLPSRPKQDRIAGILSAYDELMENCQRRIRILEEMARALYREWFVHFRFPGHEKVPRVDSPLGAIPQGWEAGRLDDVLVLQRGFDLPKADRAEGAIPIYAATGVTGFHSEAKVKAPGVVTGRSGTIGDVLYVQEDFWPLNTALWVKEFPKAEPLYAYYVLSSLDLKQFNSGAAVPTLNRNDIHGLGALIPPRPLQKRFHEIAGAMLAQIRTLELKIQNLRRTRDLLLPRLLSGQVTLDVSAVEDVAEPTAPAPRTGRMGSAAFQAAAAGILPDASTTTRTRPSPQTVRQDAEPGALEARAPLFSPDSDDATTLRVAEEAPVPIDQIDRTAVLQVIRQVFSEGPPRERDAAIRDVARALGYRRTGARIHEILHTDLLTAVRRGILANTGGALRLLARSITDYERDFLKQQFLAAIGRPWIDRDTATRDFCRWLGFARTGPVIEDTARSLIKSLLREGRLEADGAELIRRV